MDVLNWIAGLVGRLVAVLPAGARPYLGFPAYGVAVLVLLWLFVRQVLGRLMILVGWLTRVVVTAAGAVLLVPEAVAAALARRAGARPPEIAYSYGDAVATSVVGAGTLASRLSGLGPRLARLPFIVILLLATLSVWHWNNRQCPAPPVRPVCTAPATAWIDAFHRG